MLILLFSNLCKFFNLSIGSNAIDRLWNCFRNLFGTVKLRLKYQWIWAGLSHFKRCISSGELLKDWNIHFKMIKVSSINSNYPIELTDRVESNDTWLSL